jgi:chromatin segregation and condensation protein Rec8/ScpA/Scc1 (kleisin family)
MDYVSKKIKEQGSTSFFALCRDLGMTRDVIIVTFLAILELVRRHRIEFEQPELDDDIRLFPIGALN